MSRIRKKKRMKCDGNNDPVFCEQEEKERERAKRKREEEKGETVTCFINNSVKMNEVIRELFCYCSNVRSVSERFILTVSFFLSLSLM